MVDDRLLVEILAAAVLIFLAFWRKERAKADVEIKKGIREVSKTEGEVYKTVVERQLVELKVNELIDARIVIIEEKYKNMLWNKEKEHYEVKLEMQQRLIESIKDKTEAVQENEILKNELEAIREQYDQQGIKIESQEKQIQRMQKEINELKKQTNVKSK